MRKGERGNGEQGSTNLKMGDEERGTGNREQEREWRVGLGKGEE